jgi:pyridinium-3,5-bisthiocarboxylic acid mononucleotide nickel chelatase
LEIQIEIGGRLTGDVFIAALLDAFPDYEDAVVESIDAVSESYPVDCRLEYVRDSHLRGRRFIIEPYTRYFGHLLANPDEVHQTWATLRQRLQSAALGAGVRRHAMAILTLVTREMAAGQDHSLDTVTFSSNQVWQMVTQAVGVAAIIDGLGSVTWSAYAVGREIPTPIGRAILTHLEIPHRNEPQQLSSRSILRSGAGFAAGGSAHEAYLRVNCFDGLREGAMPGSSAGIAAARDNKNSSRS